MKLTEAKRKFPNEWIAFKWKNRSKNTGKVLIHDPDRRTFDARLLLNKRKLNGTYLLYTGPKPLLPKNWGTLLCMK